MSILIKNYDHETDSYETAGVIHEGVYWPVNPATDATWMHVADYDLEAPDDELVAGLAGRHTKAQAVDDSEVEEIVEKIRASYRR